MIAPGDLFEWTWNGRLCRPGMDLIWSKTPVAAYVEATGLNVVIAVIPEQ